MVLFVEAPFLWFCSHASALHHRCRRLCACGVRGRGVRENAQMERMDGGPILQDSHFLDPLLLWFSVVSHMEMLMSVRERMSSCSSPRGERESAGCRCAHSTDVPCAPQPPSCRPRRFVLRRRRRRSSSARTYVNPPIRFTAPLVCNGGLFIAVLHVMSRHITCMCVPGGHKLEDRSSAKVIGKSVSN